MIQQLSQSDILALLDLVSIAGWNQTADDLERLLSLDPEGCLGIRCDVSLVATSTLLCHNQNLAWLGMVLTHPAYRRRGFARALVAASLDIARDRAVRTVKLDASSDGRPLYADLGFVDEQSIERWRREPGPQEALPSAGAARSDGALAENWNATELPLAPSDLTLDAAAFGADRSRFLRALGPVLRFESGFLMHRAGRLARHLGPCVATEPAQAEAAIRATIAASTAEAWIWDLLPSNSSAAGIARRAGFAPVRQLTRMRLGPPTDADDRLVMAIAGFEAG